MNATVTDAHRQKCADLANEQHERTVWRANEFDPFNEHEIHSGPLSAFAQYVANTEARDQSILSAITGPGRYADKLAAVRAIVEPVDPLVLRAREYASLVYEGGDSELIAAYYRAGKYDHELGPLIVALREGVWK